jgi:hypothetical protein
MIKYNDLKLNVYVTHLHANYSVKYEDNEFSDIYLAHRVSQLYELGQFIRQTSDSADMSILLGDLNTCDYENGYKLLRCHSHLLDAFKERQVGPLFLSSSIEKYI